MREVKIPKARQKTMKCPKCRSVTSTLRKKAWRKKPLRNFTELIGYYKCKNCGISCSKIFATELI